MLYCFIIFNSKLILRSWISYNISSNVFQFFVSFYCCFFLCFTFLFVILHWRLQMPLLKYFFGAILIRFQAFQSFYLLNVKPARSSQLSKSGRWFTLFISSDMRVVHLFIFAYTLVRKIFPISLISMVTQNLLRRIDIFWTDLVNLGSKYINLKLKANNHFMYFYLIIHIVKLFDIYS